MRNKFGNMRFGRPYRVYVRPSRRRRACRWMYVLLAVTSVMYCVVAAAVGVRPVVEDVAQRLIVAKSTDIINRTVLDTLGEGDMYAQLCDINYDTDGRITSISANAAGMNRLKSEVAVDILNSIEQFGSEGFTIPLGNLTDILLLSGIGPAIPFRIIPYGAVAVDFRSSFSEAGVNQTRHEIYVDITTEIHAISAVAGISGTVTTSVMAAQTIIVGNVPEFVVGSR